MDYGSLTIIYITEVIYIEIFDQASAAQNPILDVTKESTARLHGFTKTSLSREKLWISMGFLWFSIGHFKWEFTDFASAFYEFKRLTGHVSPVFSFRMYESYQPT